MTVTPRDLGVPVKSINWARVFAGARRNGEPLLVACMGQDAGGLFACDIDPATGHCTQYAVGLEFATYPTAAYFSARTGVLYIGSAYTGHLHRYDANLPPGERRLEDLGPIDPELARFPCGIDEAPDGSLYIGAHPGASLTRFDPATGVFTRYGRMDDTDMYFYPVCGEDGSIAGKVRVCEPHVVAFDPATGARHTVGPTFNTQAAFAGGTPGSEPAVHRGKDGRLYVVADDCCWRIDGTDATPVHEAPPPQPASTLPDGMTVEFADGQRTGYRALRLTAPDGAERTLTLDWEGNGTSLFLVHHGPDNKIYGSSMLPEHLFVCDLDGGNMRDLGACSESVGEAYSMGNYDGKLYIGSYPYSRLSIYDPAQPYSFGTEAGCNPRDIGRLDMVGERPRAMLTGPAGKVWMGSFPDYGLWGGTLAWYDPATGESRSHRDIVPDCSVTTLEWIPDLSLILAGASIIGGTGTEPRADKAAFVLWDADRDAAVETLDFGLDISDGVIDLKYAGGGLAYAVIAVATARAPRAIGFELVLIDVVKRCVIDRSVFDDPDTTGGPIENSLRLGPDGFMYGCCRGEFYRLTSGSAQREPLWQIAWEETEQHIHCGGALVGQTYYYGSWHRLRAFDIPQKT